MNLEESYRFVEEDLKEALKITVDNVNRRWRVSIPAVHSFLARFYLFCHDYDQALKYADLALQADARLVASLQAKFGTGNVKVVEKSIEKRA